MWPNDGAFGEAAACCVVCDDSLTYLSVGCALSSPIKLPDGEGCLGPCVVVGRLFAGEATTVCLLEAQQPPCGVRMPLGVQGSGCCRTGPPGQLVVGRWALVRLQVASTCRSKLELLQRPCAQLCREANKQCRVGCGLQRCVDGHLCCDTQRTALLVQHGVSGVLCVVLVATWSLFVDFSRAC